MRGKLIPILVVFLGISIIILTGNPGASAFPAPISADSLNNPGSQTDQNNGQNSTWWIHIDPEPTITNTSIRISGTTNLPGETALSPEIFLLSRTSANDTFGKGYYWRSWEENVQVTTANDTGIWSATTGIYDPWDPEESRIKPDGYLVRLYEVPHDIYTTLIVPAILPVLTEPEGSYWVHLEPLVNQPLEEAFVLKGTTNLPEGYPLVSEIYPGIHSPEHLGSSFNYCPILSNYPTVGQNSDGERGFSIPVNFSGQRNTEGRLLRPGEYFAEVHAINTNSTVSDSMSFNLSSSAPWIHIDPIKEPARGTNLTISGTTSLSPGEQVYFYLTTASHPCPASRTPPDHDTEWTCGGSSCSGVDVSRNITVETGTDNSSVWSYETGTSNWCLNEQYFVKVSYGKDESISEDYAYFHVRAG